MPVKCVIGAQWGDEGKGKIIDLLSRDADVVIRFQGGSNAGHTVRVGKEEFVLHLVPSGILHPGCVNVIGNGVVVDPRLLIEEIDGLHRRNVKVGENLKLSDRAHLTFPYHVRLDQLREKASAGSKIGTTGRGIGPTYSDKALRVGIRVGDLYDRDLFASRLRANVAEKNVLIREQFGGEPLDAEALLPEYWGYADRLKPFVTDSVRFVSEAIKSKRRILLEGAQGAMLDVDFGTYPFVTSSNSNACGVSSGSGVAFSRIDETVGVIKAYSTRVGSGPLPTEEKGAIGDRIREKGREYGATTGRPRRCGWFDAVAVRYSLAVGGMSYLAITMLDVLSGFDEIKLCEAYECDGERMTWLPTSAATLERCRPVYRTVPGWTENLRGIKRFSDLPRNAAAYVSLLEEMLETSLRIVSVGPERDEVIIRS